MKEENKIISKVGTKNPFKVPDGYFTDFTQELMNKLPEKEILYANQEVTLWQRVKPWIYMTAMFCGIMLSVRIFVDKPNKDEFSTISQSMIDSLSDEEWQIIIERSMIDEYTLYQFLTDNIEITNP